MSEFEDKLNSILSSPEEMEKIMGIARSLSGSLGGNSGDSADSGSNAPAADLFSELDPKMLKLLSHLVREYKSPENDKTALITAMKPYLKPERQAALDKASGIVKLAHLARIALGELSGGDDN